MSVEHWYGRPSDNPAEQDVLVKLISCLEPLPEHFVVMSNFHAGTGPETDLVILKQQAVLMAEVKHVWEKVVGDRNGDWKIHRPNGEVKNLRNPFQQVLKCSYSWKDWIVEQLASLEQVSGLKRGEEMYKPLLFVLLCPEIPQDSDIKIGAHPVQLMNVSDFRAAVRLKTSAKTDLTPSEVRAIPRLLHLNPDMRYGLTTERLEQFKPPAVKMLVARGHHYSDQMFHLTKTKIKIGRDPSNDLVIENRYVSRHHAELELRDGRWTVRDLDSDNGTWVCFKGDPNVERCVNGENLLQNSSIVRFGDASYTLILE